MRKYFLLMALFSSPSQTYSANAANANLDLCNNGNGNGCHNYALKLKEGGNQEESKSYFEQGCKLGTAYSCVLLADLAFKNNNPGQALSFYNQACTIGLPAACFHAGLLNIGIKEYSKGTEQLKKSCGDGRAGFICEGYNNAVKISNPKDWDIVQSFSKKSSKEVLATIASNQEKSVIAEMGYMVHCIYPSNKASCAKIHLYSQQRAQQSLVRWTLSSIKTNLIITLADQPKAKANFPEIWQQVVAENVTYNYIVGFIKACQPNDQKKLTNSLEILENIQVPQLKKMKPFKIKIADGKLFDSVKQFFQTGGKVACKGFKKEDIRVFAATAFEGQVDLDIWATDLNTKVIQISDGLKVPILN